MDALSSLLKPEVLAALTAAPFVLQWIKGIFPVPASLIAVISAALSTGLILSQAWGLCAWPCMVLQCLYGWIYIEVLYTKVVEPMAKSGNPLVPR